MSKRKAEDLMSNRNKPRFEEIFILCFFLVLFLTFLSCIPHENAKLKVPLVPNSPSIAGQPTAKVQGGPYLDQILSAYSPDGLHWVRDDGIRLEHASVPCAINDGNRVILYYVDANRGPNQPESISCAISTNGINFIRQPFEIEGLPVQKAVDPSIIRNSSGEYLLYYLASNAAGDPAAGIGDHQIQLAISDDGIHFHYDRTVFSYPGLVDPDVFFYKSKWFMYVFSRGQTIIATSDDGLDFTYLRPLEPSNWGTVAPVQLDDGTLRLYAFQQGKSTANVVRSFISTDGINWQQELEDRLTAANNEQITDPFVIHWESGYKMFFKLIKPMERGY